VRVLVTDPVEGTALERLRAAGHEVIERPGVQGAALAAALEGCHALLIGSATRVTGELLRRAGALKVIARAGAGLDNVDQTAARRAGVAVFDTPHADAVAVAELAFALMLAFERGVPAAADELRRTASAPGPAAGRELAGRRIGIVGFGRTGRELAARARGFEMGVWASDPLVSAWPRGFEWARRATLDELLPAVDFLAILVPLTPDTRGLIGARELARLRPDAVLLQCTRGGVVDEAALLDALRRGALRGALLDGVTAEPPIRDGLLEHPGVLAVPQLGAATVETARRAGDEAAAILIEALGALGT
jgi:D-3-phosphoglycerate dehydrogenase